LEEKKMANGSGLFSNAGPLKPHLLQQSGGIAAEVNDVRRDVGSAMAPMAALTVDEYTNPAGTAALATNALLAATATVAAPVQVLAAGLVAAGLAQLAIWPRRLTFTTAGSTPADAPATVTIVGTDAYGNAQTESGLALAQTGATVTSTKHFKTIVSIDYPAADGTDATVAIGAAASQVKSATATVAAAVTLGPTDIITTDLVNNPRALVFTTSGSTPADAPANVVITGKDVHDKVVTETLALAQTAAAVTSANFYKSITSLVYPTADGTAAFITITFTDALGLTKKVVARAGLAGAVREIAGGSVVTNGVLTAPTTSNKPYGSYAPNSIANGVLDYAIYYEYDPTA